MALTEKQKKKYLENGADECPYCGSADITSGGLEAEGTVAWAAVECKECGETWQDEFRLFSVE